MAIKSGGFHNTFYRSLAKHLLMRKVERDQAYIALIKIDNILSWIELRETFHKKTEAQESAKEKLSSVKIKVVKLQR